MSDVLGGQMVAAYTVRIEGMKQAKDEVAKVGAVIKRLRQADYSESVPTVTVASQLGGSDILVSKMEDFEGNVQTRVRDAMSESMAFGKATQRAALEAAETPTGLAGRSHSKGGRKGGPGRTDTKTMVNDLKTNVEIARFGESAQITGWHGWGAGGSGGEGQQAPRRRYYVYQEKGTRTHSRVARVRKKAIDRIARGRSNNSGVPAANSLGIAIPATREHLKRSLQRIKR